MIDALIGEKFWLWPLATYRSEGILLSADEHGLYFKITMSHTSKYRDGDFLFISKSKSIDMILLEGGEEE